MRVGDYQIHDLLGRGGQASVYRAVSSTGQVVAVKVLAREGGEYQASDIARFERELEILERLRNPHIVELIDHGITPEGDIWAAFEFIEGADVRTVLEVSGPMPEPLVRHVLRQVLEALSEAHRQGLVHRDLKPENIRFTPVERDPHFVKVLDFGIARTVDNSMPSLTATGELIGTPRYMAPEQLTGRQLSPAADIYGLGLVAIELLFGADALPGGSLAHQLDRMREGFDLVPTRLPSVRS